MSPVAVSADRRFHRAHVKPARRRSAWQRVAIGVVKVGLLLWLLVVAGGKATTFLSSSPLLRIDRISPTGNQRVSSETVRAILEGLRGENILFVDLEAWRAKLLESPWVRDASFRRSLPSTVEVLVQERMPIAIGRLGSRLYLVDERGAVIDEYGPRYSSLDLPIVDGFAATGGSEKADQMRGALAARLIMALKQEPAVARRLSQVNVSDPHNVAIILDGDPAELRLGDDRFLTRVQSYLSLSNALHERVPVMDYVDLRFDGRVYVRPLGKPGSSGSPGAGHSKVSRVTDAQQQ
jgi:cell division protein FtsQ